MGILEIRSDDISKHPYEIRTVLLFTIANQVLQLYCYFSKGKEEYLLSFYMYAVVWPAFLHLNNVC